MDHEVNATLRQLLLVWIPELQNCQPHCRRTDGRTERIHPSVYFHVAANCCSWRNCARVALPTPQLTLNVPIVGLCLQVRVVYNSLILGPSRPSPFFDGTASRSSEVQTDIQQKSNAHINFYLVTSHHRRPHRWILPCTNVGLCGSSFLCRWTLHAGPALFGYRIVGHMQGDTASCKIFLNSTARTYLCL